MVSSPTRPQVSTALRTRLSPHSVVPDQISRFFNVEFTAASPNCPCSYWDQRCPFCSVRKGGGADANALSLGFQPLPLLTYLKPLNRHRLYGKLPVFSARRPSWNQKRVTEQLPHFLPLHATYRDSILIKTFSISPSSLEEAAPSSSITPAIRI